MVLATQNPIESYGTFPLPEAQLDRFFMRIKIGYPTRDEEVEIVNRNKNPNMLDNLEKVITQEEVDYVRNNYSEVKISEEVMDYLLDIVEKTRTIDISQLGVSPRGTIALFKASQVYASINGRDYIIPEDIKEMAPYVLNHRVILKGISKDRNIYSFIKSLVDTVKVPVEEM
jgi:MoxR-like ATPase